MLGRRLRKEGRQRVRRSGHLLQLCHTGFAARNSRAEMLSVLSSITELREDLNSKLIYSAKKVGLIESVRASFVPR